MTETTTTEAKTSPATTPAPASAAPPVTAQVKPAAKPKTVAAPARQPAKTAKASAPAVAKRPVAKPAAAKPAPKKAIVRKAVTPKPVAVAKASKPEKHKKPKLIRDSFTIPKDEYEMLGELKARAVNLKQPAKKSEVLRAGIKLLASLGNAQFLAALSGVPSLKTGRPAGDKNT